MRLIDVLKNLLGGVAHDASELQGFNPIADSDGLSFCLEHKAFEELKNGQGAPLERLQMVVLRMLQEAGAAEAIANGFRLPADAVVALDEDQQELLRLPRRFPGSYRANISGRTGHSGFHVRLSCVLDDGEAPVALKGPFLDLGAGEYYLLSPAELLALQAWKRHGQVSPAERGEAANLQLMAALQAAQRSGMRLDLGHFEKLDVVVPEAVGVSATRLPDGSLILCPMLGDGSTPEQLERRWAQLDLNSEGGVLRVDNRIVLLDPNRLEGVKEVLGNRRIPRERVAEFMATPTAFLDAALVNLDMGFSVRVLGVGRLEHIEFGPLEGERPDWFGLDKQASPPSPPAIIEKLVQSPEELSRFEEILNAARAESAEVVHFDGERIDISDELAVEQSLEKTRQRLEGLAGDAVTATNTEDEKERERVSVLIDEAAEVRNELLALAGRSGAMEEPEWDLLARKPFPHQREGIAWIQRLMESALAGDRSDLYRLQGALLADDMGLGKTYMTLVAAATYLHRQERAGHPQKPILVVAPLSLLENWEDEVGHTFHAAPFRDIVTLQAGKHLSEYRAGGVARESVQLADLLREDGTMDESAIRYALLIGPEAGARRLDMDRRLVLTTYQTLRDYQFSLCRIDWGLVVFDEAQNIKNPNALQTRAAKGLKADFKLLATGTPVENSLGDFWCLFDTAQPGLLGPWKVFREQWIKPIVDAADERRDEVRREIGSALRAAVGSFMLRRIKEDQLKGLPSKTVHCGVEQPAVGNVRHEASLGRCMRGPQLIEYDAALESYRTQRVSNDMRGQALAVLSRLRAISLHPQLDSAEALLTRSAEEARSRMSESAKLEVLLGVLDEVRRKGEKVILFMVTKRLQRALKLWLDQIYGLDIAIINGDTAAVPRKSDILSRKQLITEFEKREGFNLLIMSPVAAGVGLTVIGANHVVHLERHWNPAKEAQASDRVYRIGQTRDVHIHLPAATHPQFDSFDVHLDRLLRGKLMLKDAVVTPEAVSEEELMRSMGL